MAHLLPDKPPNNWRNNNSNTELTEDQDSKQRERKNGAGNVYNAGPGPGPGVARQGTLLDKWKEYTKGEDEDSIINNIYTPQTSAGGDVIVAKKENLQTEISKQKLRDLRLKAIEREKAEEEGKNQFTALVPKPRGLGYEADDRDTPGSTAGGTFYAVPNQHVANVEDSDEEDESNKRKEKWYKRAGRMFKHKHSND